MWPRFEEAVRARRAYLTPRAQPFKGRFYTTEGVTLEPTLVQARCTGGRPRAPKRSFSSPMERIPWGKCVSL